AVLTPEGVGEISSTAFAPDGRHALLGNEYGSVWLLLLPGVKEQEPMRVEVVKPMRVEGVNVQAQANKYVTQGLAHAKDHRWPQAIESYSKAVELLPDYAWGVERYRELRAEAHVALAQYEKADADCAWGVERFPQHREWAYRHALLRLELNDTDGYRRTC